MSMHCFANLDLPEASHQKMATIRAPLTGALTFCYNKAITHKEDIEMTIPDSSGPKKDWSEQEKIKATVAYSQQVLKVAETNGWSPEAMEEFLDGFDKKIEEIEGQQKMMELVDRSTHRQLDGVLIRT